MIGQGVITDFGTDPVPHLVAVAFVFAFGACVGSFLNVVAYRLPNVPDGPGGYGSALRRSLAAISYPPSHCPRCQSPLKWYDNLPVIGWLALRGRCRTCRLPISVRYPLVEAGTGLLFSGLYAAYFVFDRPPPPCRPEAVAMTFAQHWPMFGLMLYVAATLVAISLIDAATFTIPLWPVWILGIIGVTVHALVDGVDTPGSLTVEPVPGALAAGGLTGLIVSILLLRAGVFRPAFATEEGFGDGVSLASDPPPFSGSFPAHPAGPINRVDDVNPTEPPDPFPPKVVRREMRHEMLFLMPPMLLGGVATMVVAWLPAAGEAWGRVATITPVSAALGAVLGGLVGGFVVWLTRILGSIGFGREAMGLGDVHLMAGVGACVGAGAATVAFFLAPFFGIATALTMLIWRRGRELPYGPYLSLATVFVLVWYCPIAAWLRPGVAGFVWFLTGHGADEVGVYAPDPHP